MVGVDGSSPFAPTKFGREIKHLAETLGAFFWWYEKSTKKTTQKVAPLSASIDRTGDYDD